MTTEIVRASDIDLDQLQRMAKMLAVSGYFDASQDGTQAIAQMATKILAGRELGYGPFASVQGIHVIKGKPALSANLMAAAVKAHPHYDYKVRKMANDEVIIEFFEDKESIGLSSFNREDATAAGTQNLSRFPRNMLFARAMSNGVRWYCPDVFYGNAVYTPEELGARVDEETGEIIEQSRAVKVVVDEVGHRNVTQPEQPAEVNFYQPEQPMVEAPAAADNPFDDPTVGKTALEQLDYMSIAKSLTGNAAKLIGWAIEKEGKSKATASEKQYNFLAGEIDKITSDQHTYVLSVICGRLVNQRTPCSKELASYLLDNVQGEKYRQDIVDTIKEIAAMRQPALPGITA